MNYLDELTEIDEMINSILSRRKFLREQFNDTSLSNDFWTFTNLSDAKDELKSLEGKLRGLINLQADYMQTYQQETIKKVMQDEK